MELKFRSTRFIGGNDYPSFVDYLIWPWIERLPAVIAIIRKERNWQKYLSSKYPLLVKYMLAMYEDNTVKSIAFNDEIHEEFLLFRMKLTRGDKLDI
ncbi:glutathione S transferase O3-like protein [Leptotrombidium deliense]|uniref:Glutathione S transferase O3-like protein n=1 Tax=Leptotrombidium deliense TaxID=299467 RepID=A0A443RXD6_9ACAR|nr:glutathione S transferase O3-like protein [Leptotrombidium deliense]